MSDAGDQPVSACFSSLSSSPYADETGPDPLVFQDEDAI
jgi:hypothetical protein